MKSIAAISAGLIIFGLGVGSPATATDLDSAPWCPIGIHWNGEPLPIGCKTTWVLDDEPFATGAYSSDPAVLRVGLDQANNRVNILTTGLGTAEVCYEYNLPRTPTVKGKNRPLVGESCISYSVSPELARNCMATEVNAGGYEVSNMHIHVGCETSFGNAPGGPPVTQAWSSDPSILQVWVEGGQGKYRALTPGKATYCWTGVVNSSQGVGDPDYPVCFTERIHPLTVNVAPLRRSEVDPPCDFDAKADSVVVHTGCTIPLSFLGSASARSSNPDIVYVSDFGWLITARPGESIVCFTGSPEDHCLDVTVLDPNLEIPAPATDDEASEASSEEK